MSDFEATRGGQEFVPNKTLSKMYPEAAVGGYSRVDGSIEFYTRVNALVNESSHVLDFGAGRAQWAVDPLPGMAFSLRHLQGRVRRVVATDIDEAVLENPAADERMVVPINAKLPFGDRSFDLVVADHVFEHVDEQSAQGVADDLMRVIQPGGWLAARTPNKWGMIGLGARAVPNSLHVRFLRKLQPDRKPEDVFPVRYAMNTKRDIRRLFAGQKVVVYGHTSEPAYFGDSLALWRGVAAANRLTPPILAPTLMIFVQRQGG